VDLPELREELNGLIVPGSTLLMTKVDWASLYEARETAVNGPLFDGDLPTVAQILPKLYEHPRDDL
jgi:hypothetical protein